MSSPHSLSANLEESELLQESRVVFLSSVETGGPKFGYQEVLIVKAMVFPVVMYGCESWTIRKAEH